MPRQYRYTILFTGWMVLITLLSLVSFEGLPDDGVEIPYMDKLVHFVFHAGAAVLGSLFLWEQSGGKTARNPVLVRICLALLIYGIIIEVLQMTLTTYRSAEIADVFADIAGAISGAAAVALLYGRDWQLKWKN